MHWLWRAMIAVVAGFLIQTGSRAMLARHLSPSDYGNIYLQLGLGVVHVVIPIAVYGLLTYGLSPVYVQHRRREKGLCVKCSYDLTGNVSGICPECGEKV